MEIYMAEAIIFIHGMGRKHHSFKSLQKEAERQGYITYNQSYPSTKQKVEVSSEQYIGKALDALKAHAPTKIHFVTHSLGGLLIRYYLSHYTIKNLGAIVMLAPPNQGSHVTERYKSLFWYKTATGVAGQQLGISNNPFLTSLKPINTKLLVIAGTRSSDPWFNSVFDEAHDGKVSVSSTKLTESHEHITIEVGHTFIMNNPKVQKHTFDFLNNYRIDEKL